MASQDCHRTVADTVFFSFFGLQAVVLLVVMVFVLEKKTDNFEILREFKVQPAFDCFCEKASLCFF